MKVVQQCGSGWLQPACYQVWSKWAVVRTHVDRLVAISLNQAPEAIQFSIQLSQFAEVALSSVFIMKCIYHEVPSVHLQHRCLSTLGTC